jgi:hypothetical protein
VLEQQQRVGDLLRLATGAQVELSRKRVAVGDRAEAPDLDAGRLRGGGLPLLWKCDRDGTSLAAPALAQSGERAGFQRERRVRDPQRKRGAR